MNSYGYDEITLGMEESFSVTITQELINSFGNITGDINPLHTNEQFALDKGFSGKVCYGMLTASFFSTLAGVYLPGENSLIHRVEIDFTKPVYVGDSLCVKGTVTKKMDAFKTIVLSVNITNSQGTEVCRGKMRIGII